MFRILGNFDRNGIVSLSKHGLIVRMLFSCTNRRFGIFLNFSVVPRSRLQAVALVSILGPKEPGNFARTLFEHMVPRSVFANVDDITRRSLSHS